MNVAGAGEDYSSEQQYDSAGPGWSRLRRQEEPGSQTAQQTAPATDAPAPCGCQA
jgi:hypothetical protein